MAEIKNPIVIAMRAQRDREIRDLYDHLGKQYKYHAVLAFFQRNYCVTESYLMQIIRRVDDQPVNDAITSIQYRTAIKTDFHL